MLWGGRFKKELNKKALQFSTSLPFDIELIFEDIKGSIAHARALEKAGIITQSECELLVKGLHQIKIEYNEEHWQPDPSKHEDIHSAIEARLYEHIGETAGKLHTGRSRNDQITTDLKLWIKKSSDKLVEELKKLQRTFITIAKNHTETIIPGYTHLQRAQPVSLAFHLLAYVEMFERDKNRFCSVKNNCNQSPLGAGALAGSGFPLDRNYSANLLGFEKPTANALDTVSDRDFVLDFLHSASTGMMHLSRLCEELILWNTKEWNFIKIGDEFTTGSSLMPQKKNPDMLELIRGKSGRVFGNYSGFLVTLKSLPLAYNRDLQEDKEPLFDSFYTYIASLELLNELIKTVEFNTDRFTDELSNDFIVATDLAEWLVLKGIPFREAHKIVGNIIISLEEKNTDFKDITLFFLKDINPVFDESVMEIFNLQKSLERKKTFGSPNPVIVKDQIKEWENRLNK